MNSQKVQILTMSPANAPIAVVLAQKLVGYHNTSSSHLLAQPTEDENDLLIRATQLTATLRHIKGYDHYGLNE